MVEGRAMVDGGLLNPVPFDCLAGKAEIVLGVDVVGGPEGPGANSRRGQATGAPGRLDAMFGASQLMMQTIISMKMKASPPDLLIRPAINRFRVLDFLRADEIFAATVAPRMRSSARWLRGWSSSGAMAWSARNLAPQTPSGLPARGGFYHSHDKESTLPPQGGFRCRPGRPNRPPRACTVTPRSPDILFAFAVSAFSNAEAMPLRLDMF